MTRGGGKIGAFEVVRALGRGGMGEVSLARDTRLGREVAIKALPAHLASDPERLARLQREARVLASLNHPGIGAIYGLEEVEGRPYLILEYVEGTTLAERLLRGRVAVDEAIEIAKRIASAVEAAHGKGIIHRDLKPGNVMVTGDGTVKVLDFGLARNVESPPSVTPDSPTITSPAQSPTIPGVIMGTAGYTSPEQARGKTVDKRSDIFSFGCVVYEMLAGARAFPGETVTDSVGAVLHREPDWSLLPAGLPARMREALELCLTKDVQSRWHDIGDARMAIGRAMHEAPPAVRAPRPRRALIAVALTVMVVAGVLVARALRSAPSPELPVRFTVQAPPGTSINSEAVNSAISSDGRRLAFIAGEAGQPSRLWVRDFADVASRDIPGTEGALLPFWSPDSRSIAYFAREALWRVGAEGGPSQRLADAPGGRGGAWSETGVILFVPLVDGPLHAVPQTGGSARQATELLSAIGETGHRFPQFLPGGRKFVYTSMSAVGRQSGQDRTYIGSLDTRVGRELVAADGRATFAEPGWMLYERSGVLYAQRLDIAGERLVGDAIVTGIVPGGTTHFGGHFPVSAGTGAVACPIDGVPMTRVVEFGLDGKAARTLGAPAANYAAVSVPESGRHAVAMVELASRREFRLIDLSREGVWNRLSDESLGWGPRWSRDGKWVYFSADRESRHLFRCVPGGSSELVLKTENPWTNVRDVSSDGRIVIFSEIDPRNRRDLWLIDLDKRIKMPIAATANNEFDARLSPDGRLIAIALNESEYIELYVQAFPEGTGRTRVSVSGLAVTNPGNPTDSCIRWSADGSTLFYVDADGRTVRSARVGWTDGLASVGEPMVVMQVPPDVMVLEIGPEGKNAYGAVRVPGQAPCSIAVTLNWEQLLSGQRPSP